MSQIKPKKGRFTLTVDPGLSGTGVAVFESRRVAPVHTQVIHGKRDNNWGQNCLDITERVKEIADKWNVRLVYCEAPAYFQSHVGKTSARSGSLVKLTHFVGVLHGTIRKGFILVSVEDWKGQLPKKVVQARITAALGAKACTGFRSHVWDAVGIGLYLKGKL